MTNADEEALAQETSGDGAGLFDAARIVAADGRTCSIVHSSEGWLAYDSGGRLAAGPCFSLMGLLELLQGFAPISTDKLASGRPAVEGDH